MKKVKNVLVYGNFNILHPGHIRLLRFAKEQGFNLIVGVQSDRLAAGSSYVKEEYRLEGIRSNNLVDESFIFDEPPSELVARIRPDIVVRGKEHENAENPELEVLKEYGGKLLFSSGESTFSALDALSKELGDLKNNSISIPFEYLSRHDINKMQLANTIKSFEALRVCVIGDLIIDEYVTCEPLGMSQEDPTIVVTPLDTIRFIGGAGIVAAHAAGLGARVDFISVVGNDEDGEYASDELIKYGVKPRLVVDESRPTTLKRRYRSKGKSLLRVSKLHQGLISTELQNEIITNFKEVVNNIDLLIFSDFNYGCLPQKLVDEITCLTQEENIFVSADSQSSSQVGDIGRYKNVNLITPTEREARISLRDMDSGLIVLAENLRNQTGSTHIFLKMGEEGFIIYSPISDSGWISDRVEALNTMPKDVSGAGDSLLTVASMALVSGASVWEAGCLGALAAALQVGRLGNKPLRIDELLGELRL